MNGMGIRNGAAVVGEEPQASIKCREGREILSLETAVLDIEGMTCAVCTGTVEGVFGRIAGVESAEVSLAAERATIFYDPGQTGPSELVSSVEDAGYGAKVAVLDDEGGVAPIDPKARAAKARKKIRSAQKSLAFSLVFSLPVVILSMGVPHRPGDTTGLFAQPMQGISYMSLLQWALATPVQFISGATFYRGAWKDVRNRSLGMNFLVAGGTSAAYLYSVVLVLLAVGQGGGTSMLFFETSAALLSFVLLGKLLEELARGKASDAVGKLMSLRADSALVVPDWPECIGGEEEVGVEDLRPGAVVKVIRGAKVPADGVVLQGSAAVDEAMITGESMPVAKEEGSSVIGATICREGLLYVRVIRTGKGSKLYQIISLIEKAQASKPPIQEFGDRVAAVFVPMVVTFSLLTLVVWFSLSQGGIVPESWYREQPGSPGPSLFSFMFALAVLVIACPCAIGLATPTAIMVGTGVAASNGVLIKDGGVLQKACEVTKVVFDKTGTLTAGEPRVAEVVWVGSMGVKGLAPTLCGSGSGVGRGVTRPPAEVLRLVAAAERHSEHPLAKALVEYVGSEGVSLETSPEEGSFAAVSGKGLSCTVEGVKVTVGSPGYVWQSSQEGGRGQENGSSGEEWGGSVINVVIEVMETAGRTVVAVALDDQVSAFFCLEDTIRQEAKGVVDELHRMGVEVWMLSGDNRRAAAEVARRVGIPEECVVAEVLPEEKAGKIEQLQRDKSAVAMVGDGINDAPALVQGDVGMAVAGGADVAMESADVVLMSASLRDIVVALDLCRVILHRVKINYAWALAYNTLGLPIAAGALFPALRVTLPPELAGAAMALSSVSVVLSSLALRLYRPPNFGKTKRRAAGECAGGWGLLRKSSLRAEAPVTRGRPRSLFLGTTGPEERVGAEGMRAEPGTRVIVAGAGEGHVLPSVKVLWVDKDCSCSCCSWSAWRSTGVKAGSEEEEMGANATAHAMNVSDGGVDHCGRSGRARTSDKTFSKNCEEAGVCDGCPLREPDAEAAKTITEGTCECCCSKCECQRADEP